jgi:hypothetical protein
MTRSPSALRVQLLVQGADLEYLAAGLVIADLDGPGGCGEFFLVEFFETRQLGQEARDLRQFVHGPILTRLAPT